MKRILFSIVTLVTCFIDNSVLANAFDGAYVGGQTGFILSNTKTNLTNETVVNIAKSAGASTKTNKNSIGFIYGIYGGYGLTLNDHYYLGAEISVLGDTAKHTMNLSVTDAGSGASYSSSSNYKRGFVFGATPRIGYIFGGTNMIYLKPSIEFSKDKATATLSATPSGGGNAQKQTVSASKTNIVIAPAAGFEKALGPLLLRTEYTYNMGKKIGLNSNNGPVTEVGNVSYKDHRFSVGAAYKF